MARVRLDDVDSSHQDAAPIEAEDIALQYPSQYMNHFLLLRVPQTYSVGIVMATDWKMQSFVAKLHQRLYFREPEVELIHQRPKLTLDQCMESVLQLSLQLHGELMSHDRREDVKQILRAQFNRQL